MMGWLIAWCVPRWAFYPTRSELYQRQFEEFAGLIWAWELLGARAEAASLRVEREQVRRTYAMAMNASRAVDMLNGEDAEFVQ